MDAPVKNPVSETLTSEAAAPEAESIKGAQQVKSVPETLNLSEKTNAKNSERTDVKNVEKPDVKNSEDPEETVAAGISSHSSVNALESSESCAKKVEGTVIPQQVFNVASSVAEVSIPTAYEGKGTSNTKDSLQSCANEDGSPAAPPDCSMLSSSTDEVSMHSFEKEKTSNNQNISQRTATALKTLCTSRSFVYKGRITNNNKDSSQPSSASVEASPFNFSTNDKQTSLSSRSSFWPSSETKAEPVKTCETEEKVISIGNSPTSSSKVQSIKAFFDGRETTQSKDISSSTAGYESIKTSVIEEVAIVTPDNASYPYVSTTELRKDVINDGKEAGVFESSLQLSVSRSVCAGVVPNLKQMAYEKVISEISARPGNVEEYKEKCAVSTKYQNEKTSTSTPCLSQSETANMSDEKPVIQKASSSPILLPIIKITEVNDDDEENVVSENLKPIGNETEATKHSDDETECDDPVATAELISIDDVSHCDENQAAARSSDPLIPFVESEVTEDVRQDEEQKAFFYISSSEIPREMQYQSYEELSISHRGLDRSEQPNCLGSKGLHGGIILLSIVVAFVGFAVYSLAARGQVPDVFETIGLSATALAFVTGLFSSLYISVQMFFQNRYARIEDIETVTSIERLMYPDDYNLETGSPEIERAYRNQSLTSDVQIEQLERVRLVTNQPSTSALLDHTQKLKSEVSGLLETLTNQPLEDSAEESPTGDVSDKLSSFESALNHWLDSLAASEASVYASAEMPSESEDKKPAEPKKTPEEPKNIPEEK